MYVYVLIYTFLGECMFAENLTLTILNMITEDISDVIKGSVAFGIPTTTFMGVPLQEWMYIVSICAAVLLILERMPSAYNSLRHMYARIKE